jgi:hypothetical protein
MSNLYFVLVNRVVMQSLCQQIKNLLFLLNFVYDVYFYGVYRYGG